MGTSSKKAANTIREAAKKILNSPVKFFNFQSWIEGRTPIKQKNKNKSNNTKVNEKPKTKRRLFKKK